MSEPEQDSPLVSIVVPVYNVAQYLEDSLRSLLQQELRAPYEIILVDDCSSDDSLAICRRYAEQNRERIRLFPREINGGVSSARNFGLAQARGTYLMFVDADDILPPGALATLCDAATQKAVDIVKGNLVLFDDKTRKPAPDRVRRETRVNGEAILTTLFEHSQVRGHVGGKVVVLNNRGFNYGSGAGLEMDAMLREAAAGR